VPGGLAPDFDYLASPYGWSRFGVLCAEGPVLLVFDPADSVLAALERETAQLEPLGVIVVAVRSRDSDDNWETIRRLGLRFRLFSDPHATLADSFGVAGAPAAPDRPWWCVVGADRRVRTAGAGLADGVGFAAAIAPALGEPAATGAATASD
jgi:peroxiredoxin